MEPWFFDLQLFAEQDKTEEATPHRRQEVRKKGQVAKSADVGAAAVVAALVVLIYNWRAGFLERMAGLDRAFFGEAARMALSQQNLKYLVEEAGTSFLSIMAPVFLTAMAVGVAANLAQAGFVFAPELIQPKLQNINPAEGLKRIVSRRALVELLKALVKVAAVGFAAYSIIRGSLEVVLATMELEARDGFEVIAGIVYRLGIAAVAVFGVLAAVDYFYQRREFEQRLRMTKQEVKEEFKQTEGDPQVKARLREKQRQLARHRMMEQIPAATVVITNPIHLAVALKYVAGATAAPEVVAKGAGEVAQRIKERAREHRVPVVENRSLAQSLFRGVEIGQQVPVELYQAVAEVLAFVYRLDANRRRTL